MNKKRQKLCKNKWKKPIRDLPRNWWSRPKKLRLNKMPWRRRQRRRKKQLLRRLRRRPGSRRKRSSRNSKLRLTRYCRSPMPGGPRRRRNLKR